MNWDFTILIAIIVLFLIISKKRIKIHHWHHLNACQSAIFRLASLKNDFFEYEGEKNGYKKIR